MVMYGWYGQCPRRRRLIRDLACVKHGKHGGESQSMDMHDHVAHAARASAKFLMILMEEYG